MLRITLVLTTTIGLLLPDIAPAAPDAVSLREAIHLALTAEHLVKAAGHDHDAASAAEAITRARFLPRVAVEESATATNSPTGVFMRKLDQGGFLVAGDLNHPDAAGDFRTTISFEQPLLDFRIGRSVAVAVQETRTRSELAEAAREEAAFGAYRAYLEVQQAKSRQQVAEQGIVDAREHLRLAELKAATGIGLKSDQLRARTFLLERELERITAANQLQMAKLTLGRAIGAAPGSAVDIAHPAQPLPLSAEPADLVRLALLNRPDLRAGDAALEKSELGVKVATAEWFPTVYGSAAYQMNDRDIPFGRDNDSWTVGLRLHWQLFDGFQRQRGAEQARALRNAAAERLARAKQDVMLEIEALRLKQQEAVQRLDLIRHAVRDSEESVRLVTRRYDHALATLLDLLESQTTLDRTRARLADAEADAALASALVYRAAGVFLQEVTR